MRWHSTLRFIGLVPLLAVAASTPDVRTLLALRAPIEAPPGMLVHLRLDPSVLGAAQPDLADLRIVGESGTAVPFVVEAAEAPRTLDTVRSFVDVRIVDVERSEARREHGPTTWRERYDLHVTEPINLADVTWELLVTTRQREYVRHVDVDVIEDGRATTRLVTGAPLFEFEGSRHDPAGNVRVDVRLPSVATDLRVTIVGEGSGWLEPTFKLRATTPVPDLARVAVALDVLARRDTDDATILDLALPGALVPDRLVFATSTGALQRHVAVHVVDDETGASSPLAQTIIYRATPEEPMDPSEVRLDHQQYLQLLPRMRQLRVVIANADSPPLANLVVTGLVPVPVVTFVTPAEPIRLYLGGPRVRRPRYDVTGLAAAWRKAARGTAATLGAVEPNPAYDPTPLLDIAMQPAKPLDPRLFSHARTVTIADSPDGLSYVDLDVDDLVVAATDLSDVRIVDGDDRQWPYLVDESPTPRWLARPLEPLRSSDGWSRHRLRIAEAPIAVDRIEIAAPTPVVDREVRLLASDATDAPIVARGTIGRAPFVAALGGGRHREFVVAIRDGDEVPIPLTEGRLRILAPRLDVVAPAGTYTLLIGDREADAPEYTLARIRSVVREARGEPAEIGPLTENPAHSRSAGLLTGAWLGRHGPQIAIWIVLLGGGLVLVLLTLRAVRRGPDDGEG